MVPALDNYRQLKLPLLMPALLMPSASYAAAQTQPRSWAQHVWSHQGDDWIYWHSALGSRSLKPERSMCQISTSPSNIVFAKTVLWSQAGKQPHSPRLVCQAITQQPQLFANTSRTMWRLNSEAAFPAVQGRKHGGGFISEGTTGWCSAPLGHKPCSHLGSQAHL